MPLVAIDARMARSSGIGTYIREVVPRVFSDAATRACTLLGPPDLLRSAGLGSIPGGEIVSCTAPIYSLREQLELPRRTPSTADLFWSPHYNIPLLHRGKLLVTVHDILHVARPEFVRGSHRRLYARLMLSAVEKRATRIVCDSEFTAGELGRHAGIDRSRITVIPLGVGDDWRGAAPGPSPRARPYFVYVGNVKPHKNLARLIAAFARLIDEIPHELVVVGKVEGFITGDRAVVDAASRLGERVVFTGEVDDDEVRRLVASADALILPSLYEGFGLPALEAMAAGCPVLASRAASLPEVCGDAALYFDPVDVGAIAAAMRGLASTPSLRTELIQAGRERANAFTWERCAARTAEVIEGVLAS